MEDILSFLSIIGFFLLLGAPFIIIRILILAIPNLFRRKKARTTPPSEANQETDCQEETNDPIEYNNKYQKKLLLTKNEYAQYKKLKEYADTHNLLICPKVRLLDLIEPRKGDPKYKTLFYKIQAKHVDFVICDHNLYAKAILEIDDNSHDQADRKVRDEFVDTILRDVGYTVIRTKYISEETFKALEQVRN